MTTDQPISTLPSSDFQSPLAHTHVTLQSFGSQTSPLPATPHLQLENGSDHFLRTDSDPYGQEVRPLQFGGEGAGPVQGAEPAEPAHFPSYGWRLNDVGGDTPRQLPHWPHPFNCFGNAGISEATPPVPHPSPDQSEGSSEALALTHLYADQSQGCKPWDAHSETPHDFTFTFPAPAGVYSTGNPSSEPHYTFQCLLPPSRQDPEQPALYPKPLYSYSILIFLALRHSQTGSLPVSEIYSFMAEHFPYFQTAPDGWKNSVRHNLSLNKCFEKVEPRAGGGAGGGARGGASRKGCLWALNPARVERMMDELHKWRRKDPLTVRQSMARPEELECLLGDWPDRRRLGPAHLPRGPSGIHRRHFLAPPTATWPHPSVQSLTVIGRRPSPLPRCPDAYVHHPAASLERTHPAHGAALQAEHCGSTHAQEGALGSDVDSLRPSLTHLPLQGELWEQVRDDSLAPDPPCPPAAPPSSTRRPPTPSPPHGYRGNRPASREEEEHALTDLCVAVTFDPHEGGAGGLPPSGDADRIHTTLL